MAGVSAHQVLFLDADAALNGEQCIGCTVGIHHLPGTAANDHGLMQLVDKTRA
ncbi:hypothetical protein D3C85_1565500 [compost metagenome]